MYSINIMIEGSEKDELLNRLLEWRTKAPKDKENINMDLLMWIVVNEPFKDIDATVSIHTIDGSTKQIIPTVDGMTLDKGKYLDADKLSETLLGILNEAANLNIKCLFSSIVNAYYNDKSSKETSHETSDKKSVDDDVKDSFFKVMNTIFEGIQEIQDADITADTNVDANREEEIEQLLNLYEVTTDEKLICSINTRLNELGCNNGEVEEPHLTLDEFKNMLSLANMFTCYYVDKNKETEGVYIIHTGAFIVNSSDVSDHAICLTSLNDSDDTIAIKDFDIKNVKVVSEANVIWPKV